jgi:hypothetical protein
MESDSQMHDIRPKIICRPKEPWDLEFFWKSASFNMSADVNSIIFQAALVDFPC